MKVTEQDADNCPSLKGDLTDPSSPFLICPFHLRGSQKLSPRNVRGFSTIGYGGIKNMKSKRHTFEQVITTAAM